MPSRRTNLAVNWAIAAGCETWVSFWPQGGYFEESGALGRRTFVGSCGCVIMRWSECQYYLVSSYSSGYKLLQFPPG